MDVLKRCVMLLLAVTTAHAEMYKCVQDGTAVYQDKPCDKGAASVKTGIAYDDAVAGCFEAKIPFYGNGDAPTTKFAVKDASGEYSFLTLSPVAMPTVVYVPEARPVYRAHHKSSRRSQVVSYAPSYQSMDGTVLKPVPRDELDRIGKRYSLTFTRGVSSGLSWNGNPDEQHPIGVYFGKDGSGANVVFASLQNGAGRAERIMCPAD